MSEEKKYENDFPIKPARNHSNRKTDDDQFVGIKFVPPILDVSKTGRIEKSNIETTIFNAKTQIEPIFPLGFDHTDNGKKVDYTKNQDFLKDRLYLLIKLIDQYGKNDDGDLEGSYEDESDFPLGAYTTIIRTFIQNGYYIEKEVKYKNAIPGKINWKRTISNVRPLIQNSSPIYTNFVVRVNENKYDNLISLIHEWCVYVAFIRFGFLFMTNFTPQLPTLSTNEIYENKEYFVSVVQDSLKSTHNDKNKLLFSAMIAMLGEKKIDMSMPFFLGTRSFLTVWEKLIDSSYGISGDNRKSFQPPARWYYKTFANPDFKPLWKDESKNEESAGHLYPDTIMLLDDYEDEVFVLDAKYYNIRNGNKPGASDINKQITYGGFAKHVMEKTLKKKNASVYNAFLIPYDFFILKEDLNDQFQENYFYFGYAKMTQPDELISKTQKKDETHDLVLGILIDTKWLMEKEGHIDKKEQLELADFIKKCYKQII